MPSRRGRRWTSKEDEQLQWWWGILSAEKLAARLERTRGGVLYRGVKILKLGPPRRGYLSMAELERHSGFKRSTIITAARRLGLPLRRQPTYQRTRRGPEHWLKKRKNYSISMEIAEKLIEELVSRPDGRRKYISYRGEWGGPNKPDACLDCGTTDRPHCSKGLCDRCYMRAWRRTKRRSVQSNCRSIGGDT